MATVALISHASPDTVAAYRGDAALSAQRFLGDVMYLANAPARGPPRAQYLH